MKKSSFFKLKPPRARHYDNNRCKHYIQEDKIMKELYNIEDVALMTGLSTRTIRHYIAEGFLEGDKSTGAWLFTSEQIDLFLQKDVIRPAVRAKRNAIVYDFMGSKPQNQGRMCVILDLPSNHEMEIMALFCKRISEMEPEAELHFASDRLGKGLRIILSGSDKDVRNLLDHYYHLS